MATMYKPLKPHQVNKIEPYVLVKKTTLLFIVRH